MLTILRSGVREGRCAPVVSDLRVFAGNCATISSPLLNTLLLQNSPRQLASDWLFLTLARPTQSPASLDALDLLQDNLEQCGLAAGIGSRLRRRPPRRVFRPMRPLTARLHNGMIHNQAWKSRSRNRTTLVVSTTNGGLDQKPRIATLPNLPIIRSHHDGTTSPLATAAVFGCPLHAPLVSRCTNER